MKIKENLFVYKIVCFIKFLKVHLTSDIRYRKKIYYNKYKKHLDLNNPIGFNEKIHNRIINDRNPIYTRLSDKFLVREYVKEKIDSKHLIELLGVYDSIDEVDVNSLPNEFVIKCNHDAGSVVICHDKKTFDYHSAKNKIKRKMMHNMYYDNREWHYKNINKKVIIEEKIDIFVDDNTPEDYKFHCFNGNPEYIEVQFGRFSSDRRINIYDKNWNIQPFLMGYKNTKVEISKPQCLNMMLDIVSELSKDFDYCRVDLYITKSGDIYFGEITFTPCNGMDDFIPSYWNEIFAKNWNILG